MLVEAELAQLSPTYKSERAQAQLVDLGAQVQRNWAARTASAADWRALVARLRAWDNQNQGIRHFDVLLLLGRAHLGAGDVDAAANVLRPVLGLAANADQRVNAAFNLGEALMRAGQFDSALVILKTASAYLPDSAHERSALALRKIGICRAMLRDWIGAERDFRTALERASESRAILHSNIGFVRTARGDLVGAVTELKRASSLAKDDPVPLINLSIAYAEQKQYALADEALDQAWLRVPDSERRTFAGANAVLIAIVKSWIRLRQTPRYTVGVVDYVRRSLGLPTDSAETIRIARNRNRTASTLIEAARQVLANQNLYGLEFLAYDFVDAALEVAQDRDIRAEAEAIRRGLPSVASERRSSEAILLPKHRARGVDIAQ